VPGCRHNCFTCQVASQYITGDSCGCQEAQSDRGCSFNLGKSHPRFHCCNLPGSEIEHKRLWVDSPGISNLPQRLLECLGGLAALDQMPVIQDDGRDGIDTLLGVEAFARSYFR
jgi:hypothetical protein